MPSAATTEAIMNRRGFFGMVTGLLSVPFLPWLPWTNRNEDLFSAQWVCDPPTKPDRIRNLLGYGVSVFVTKEQYQDDIYMSHGLVVEKTRRPWLFGDDDDCEPISYGYDDV